LEKRDRGGFYDQIFPQRDLTDVRRLAQEMRDRAQKKK
jgi:hypothetical protein